VRDLVLLATVLAALPFAVARPFFGLLLYSWLSYMRPQDHTWTIAGELPLSQVAALAMVGGLVLARRRERLLAITPQTILLVLLLLWIALSTVTAVLPEVAASFGHYWKAIAIALVTTGLVQERQRLRALWIVIAFSLGLLAAKYALHGLVRGGARFDTGPGGFFLDNNSFAVGLCMVLPMLVAVTLTERSAWVRAAAATMAVSCVITVVFTFSRGGLLTLVVVGLALLLRSRHRWVSAALVVVALAGLLALGNDRLREGYVERISTIADFEEDASAVARLEVWETCWRVFLDYPVLGVGPDNFEVVFWRYTREGTRFRVAHNAFLQLLTESGLPALLLFVALFAVSLWRLERVRRGPVPWASTYAGMLQVSLLAYATGAMFLSLAYVELVYHLIAVCVCVELASAGEAALARPPRPAPAPWLAPRQAEVA
jgi:putative inorganic carbon (HCO3(-)) transporter